MGEGSATAFGNAFIVFLLIVGRLKSDTNVESGIYKKSASKERFKRATNIGNLTPTAHSIESNEENDECEAK
jgi:hypothetical protein